MPEESIFDSNVTTNNESFPFVLNIEETLPFPSFYHPCQIRDTCELYHYRYCLFLIIETPFFYSRYCIV